MRRREHGHAAQLTVVGHDNRDPGPDVVADDDRGVADAHSLHVGDGVQRPGLQRSDLESPGRAPAACVNRSLAAADALEHDHGDLARLDALAIAVEEGHHFCLGIVETRSPRLASNCRSRTVFLGTVLDLHFGMCNEVEIPIGVRRRTALDAITTMSSPSRLKLSGVTCFRPVLAPVVVKRMTGHFRLLTSPLLARNSSITCLLVLCQ